MASFLRSPVTVVALGAGIFGGIIGGMVGLAADRKTSNVPSEAGGILTPLPVLNQTEGIAEDEQTIAVVNRVQGAVVSIVVTKVVPSTSSRRIDPFADPFWPFVEMPELPGGKRQVGGGSGFFVSSDGMIVTNRHVVEDPAAEYTVVLPDDRSFPAKVVALDPVFDVAILDIEGEGFPVVTFADSDKLQVGQTVLAIGNALDEFRNTVTKGIVSGLNRRIMAQDMEDTQILEGAIQTDAAINPGNSGGPLIDLHGQVVGVNTAVSLSGQLLGFALPSNEAKRDVEQVKAIGRISRPFLGIRYLVITPELAVLEELPVDEGVLISSGGSTNEPAVLPGSPAAEADLRESDIILAVDGMRIDEDHSLTFLLNRKSPGETVVLRVLREGVERDVNVTLQEFKPSTF